MQPQADPPVITPRAVASSRGWAWITEGFDLFKLAPGTWIGVFVLWVLIHMFATIVPLGGLAATLLTAVFQAGWMIGARALDRGGELKVDHLFAGFRSDKIGELVLMGAIYLGGLVLAGGFVLLLVGGSMLSMLMGDSSAEPLHFGLGAIIGALLFLGLTVPLIMAIWFAPALLVFHNVPPVDALKTSLLACWQNVGAFLIYGLILLFLMFLAAIPLMLGFLVLGPVIVGSIYASYRDVFAAAQDGTSP